MPVSTTISEAQEQLPVFTGDSVLEAALMPSGTEMKLLNVPFSNKELNEAGKIVSLTLTHPPVWNVISKFPQPKIPAVGEFGKVEAWRLSHAYPLRAVTWILSEHARTLDPDVIVSSRMKRMTSIAAKLRRQPDMKLTTMQDVGGCRAILNNIGLVNTLADRFQNDFALKLDAPRIYDYISSPKEDGYRSVHLVVRFRSKNPQYRDFPMRRIEIQIRSRLQHAWATALETVDFFDNQNLKLGGGDPRWKRFFVLAASVFALLENRSVVPDTPANLLDELRDLWNELRVLSRLSAWATTLQNVTNPLHANDVYLLLESDLQLQTIKITGWPAVDIEQASAEYARAELRTTEDPRNRTAVLTTAESLSELREAYPSYYGDTDAFLRQLRSVLNDWALPSPA